MAPTVLEVPEASPPAVPHAMRAEEVLAAFESDEQRGLDDAGVSRLRERYGYNELTESPPVPLWRKFLGHFTELVIAILIAAAVISGMLGEWTDALAILAIVVLNGVLGFLQEQKAERALAALQKLSAPQAKVIRNGALQVIPARELVPGDRLELEAGDNIPVDARLVEAYGLRVQEAALTGESLPQEKDARTVVSAEAALGDRDNMAYMGTVVAAGKARAVVVATGMATELGRIAGMLQRFDPEPTPLQKRLAELGKVLAIGCLGIVALVFALQLLRGGQLLEVFLLSVSLAVAAVPEGLPAVVTIALALGLQRMIRRNALIRRLPSVETLGSVTVICSDKTGTLTRNEMTVREVFAGGERYEVTGAGYLPHGKFLRHSKPVSALEESDLASALTIGVRCNNARLVPGRGIENWQIIGDPTEGALLVVGLKAGIEATDQSGKKGTGPLNAKGPVPFFPRHEHHVLYEIPFDSERKAMSVVSQESGKRVVMYSKGAPEVILAKCTSELRRGRIEPLSDSRRNEILKAEAAMASQALRVLGFAYRECSPSAQIYEETDLVFAGLMGMIDPPREEVKEAVRKCHQAGIQPIMITGDHPGTASAIARELGIAEGSNGVITGQDLNRLTDDELTARIQDISVYARVAPEHKLRIVQAWKRRGHVVAMTGDGVNDAPAVKAADIGIAMGITGSDVTKEASGMVLTDDNFASIVNAVEEGRGILDNIQKFLHYLLSSNASEVLFMLFAALVAWPAPLLAVQILWINLITDGIPALALAMEPPERDIMRRNPRPPREPIINWQRGLLMLLHGGLIASVAIIAFAWTYEGDTESLARARTIAFCVIAYAQLFYAFACRSQRYTLPELGPFSNPHLFWAIAVSGLLQLSVVTLPYAQPVFEAVAHPLTEWVRVFLLALVPVTVIEVAKLLRAWLFGFRGTSTFSAAR